jgi:hypothetical protein
MYRQIPETVGRRVVIISKRKKFFGWRVKRYPMLVCLCASSVEAQSKVAHKGTNLAPRASPSGTVVIAGTPRP